MKNPKVGERVAVYDHSHHNERFLGRIVELACDEQVWVLKDGFADDFYRAIYFLKQCRRLKPRAKPLEIECVWNKVDGIVYPSGNFGTNGNWLDLVGKKPRIRVEILE